MILESVLWGILIWVVLRLVITGFYVVEQNERAIKTVFGKASRLGKASTLDNPDFSDSLSVDERDRYNFPQLAVIKPGGPYFKMPWERIYKVSVATNLVSIAFDPEDRTANSQNTVLEAVTKDQLNISLKGQLRYTVSERNLYAFLFGVQKPIAHVMGYFISILRERIANFEAPKKDGADGDPISTSLPGVFGISINDLRKNLGDLNRHMEEECRSSAARYGIDLDAALITDIEPPQEVESALAAINTAHNQVSSEISLAQAGADQRIVQSKRAVEIETLNAQAEVQLLQKLAAQLGEIKAGDKRTLPAYLRNVRLALLSKAKTIILETKSKSTNTNMDISILFYAVLTALSLFAAETVVRMLGTAFGFYATVGEKEARVYVLFGDIVGIIDKPGFHFLWAEFGWRAFFVNWLGRSYTRKLGLDQEYLRSIPVNSEEGTPMGIGVWCEMFISDPVAHIFKNVDPQGSLSANVKNATIKHLSNLPLLEMLVNRHGMSQAVREEVSPESNQWGYKLGSVYIRKVHFRDDEMVRQIEGKVVNRLRQVTSAIKQDGLNQVNIIKSKAEQEASVEFARAASMRPKIVSETIREISKDADVLSTMFDILEYQKIIDGDNRLTLVPEGSGSGMLTQLIAAKDTGEPSVKPQKQTP